MAVPHTAANGPKATLHMAISNELLMEAENNRVKENEEPGEQDRKCLRESP